MVVTKDIPFAYRRDIPFDFALDDDGDLKMLEDIDAVNQSIYSILVSNSGDKPLEPLFGSNFEELIFENALPANMMGFEIEQRLRDGIAETEPEVVIIGIEIDMTNISLYKIKVSVMYLLGDGITTGIFDESLSLEDLTR